MTTITNAVNTVFSSLKDSTSSTSSNTTSALLDEMTGTQSVQQATKAAAQSSYLLDLSPEAQAFLKTGASGSKNPWDENFILTTKQQRAISEVIAKYADEPFTKETYDRIEAELDTLGLSPDALAIKDKARSINTTSMLLSALNGTNSDLGQALVGNGSGNVTPEQSQTKKDNYIKLVLGKWSDISTTIDADDGIDS